MAFEITTTRHFSASHQLVLYDGTLEPLHGHNWQVRVTARVGDGARHEGGTAAMLAREEINYD